MKYLRHPPVAFWTLACSALVLLVVLGVHAGAHRRPALSVSTERLADERPTADTLLDRVAQISVVATPPASGLHAWATQTEALAQADAESRAQAAGSKDPVALAYAAISQDAQALSVVATNDPTAVLALQGQIGLDHDRLSAAVAGLGVPGLPDAPTSVPSSGARSKTLTTDPVTTPTTPTGASTP